MACVGAFPVCFYFSQPALIRIHLTPRRLGLSTDGDPTNTAAKISKSNVLSAKRSSLRSCPLVNGERRFLLLKKIAEVRVFTERIAMGLRQKIVILILLQPFLLRCHAQIGQMYSRNMVITGDCQAELKPDLAVISGGVAVTALKPTDAANQLDKQLDLIRSYVQQNQGKLKDLERVRMMHSEGSYNGQPRDPSFQLAQRFRAEFAADAPVDRILDHLMELGMDRFGDNMSMPETRQNIVVVHFEIQNFDDQVTRIRHGCTVEAWKQWCESLGVKNPECSAPGAPASLQVQSFNMHSTEKLMRDGSADYLRIGWTMYQPPQQMNPPELLGNVTIHLTGGIVLNLTTSAPLANDPAAEKR
jgi:hypothetical protein